MTTEQNRKIAHNYSECVMKRQGHDVVNLCAQYLLVI